MFSAGNSSCSTVNSLRESSSLRCYDNESSLASLTLLTF
jgi:hypothetical protein